MMADEVRQEIDNSRPQRIMAFMALLGSVVLISVWQAPTSGMGVVYAGSIMLTTLMLWVTAPSVALGRKADDTGLGCPPFGRRTQHSVSVESPTVCSAKASVRFFNT